MSGVAFHDDFAAWLVEDAPARAPLPGVDPVRLSVHRNTFVVTLVDALAQAYPTCAALVGAGCFAAAARAFVRAEPPRSPVLSEVVLGFAGFAAGWPPLAATPFVADVARLEAARNRAFHAADAVPLDAAAFAPLAADPARLASTRVALHPAAHWWRAASPAHALWAAHQEAGDAPVDLSGIDACQAQEVLVSRAGYVVEVETLPAGGVAFLDALRDGATLPDAFAAAHRDGDDEGPDAATLFGLLLGRGLAIALFDAVPPQFTDQQDPS